MWLSASRTDNSLHYINTNEIPGELSHEDMISSHVKITCYLHSEKITVAMATKQITPCAARKNISK